jgi:deoxyribonuclease V
VLVGRFDEPGPDRSDWTPMVHRGEVVGAAVRTRAGARPVYVSIGHRIDLETAIDWTLRITPTYRLAEPIRLADRISRMHPG